MTHYETLGLQPSATPEEIRSAYRHLAQKLHPDKGGNLDKYIKVQEAYETLSDPIKREEYDHGEITPAEARLIDLFTQVILSGETDVIHACKVQLGKNIDTLRRGRLDVAEKLEWSRGMSGRVCALKGPDRYRQAAERCEERLSALLLETDREIAILEQAAALLVTYLPVHAHSLAYKQ